MKTIWETLIKLDSKSQNQSAKGQHKKVDSKESGWVRGAASVAPETLEQKASGHNPSSMLELQVCILV